MFSFYLCPTITNKLTMDKMPVNYKSLIINNIGRGIAFLKAKIVNITLLLLILLQSLVSSCEHVPTCKLK